MHESVETGREQGRGKNVLAFPYFYDMKFFVVKKKIIVLLTKEQLRYRG